jgi:hypothetical protein
LRDLRGLVRAATEGRISRRRFFGQALVLGLSSTAAASPLAVHRRVGEGQARSAAGDPHDKPPGPTMEV